MRTARSTPILIFALLGFTVAVAAAGEVRILDQEGILHSFAGAACPPDGEYVEDHAQALDLQNYQHNVTADTTSGCGTAGASANLAGQITASRIDVAMSCSSALVDHRYAEGSVNFRIEFEVTEPTDYQLSVLAVHTVTDDPALTGLSVSLVGNHEYQDTLPDVDVTWNGTLYPDGTYTLAGSCTTMRHAFALGGGIWIFDENGEATLTGSIVMEFSGGTVVATEPTSLGSLKASFR